MIRLLTFIFAITLPVLALAPSALALDDAAISDAIAKLSDPDAAVRERAADALWLAGRPAEPALRTALSSDDPEVVRRARSVLVRFELGLYPDTPQEILDHVSAYRGGDGVARWAAVHGLANQGNRGLRVLLGLRTLSKDEPARAAILRAVGARPHERQGAALLLADGDGDAAASILQHAALESETAARDYAALLLSRGGLDVELNNALAEAKLNPDSFSQKRVIYLARAKGDLPTALHAAEQCDEPEMVESVLIESRDWNRLARKYGESPGRSSDALGFTAAFYRLAGQTDVQDATAAALRTFADQHDDEYWNCAECLMLNDRVDDGVAVLLGHKNYLAATDFLLARLKLNDALGLVPKAKGELTASQFLQLRARAISIYIFIGDRAAANRELHEVAEENQKTKDFATWLRLIDAARELKQPADVDTFVAAAMEHPSAGDGMAVFEKAGLPNAFPAPFWWRFLRTEHLAEPYSQTIMRLRTLASGQLPAAEVEALADAAQRTALAPNFQSSLSIMDRDGWLQSIGQTLDMLGRHESAERCFRSLVALYPTYASFQLLGDCQAARGDFSGAASSYQQAWDLDASRAVPLALRGWALVKAGDNPKGRQAIELAHQLPFGDDIQRTALEDSFRTHGLADDARRERETILKTGRFFSWEVCNAHHLSGDDENARGDYLAAANSWDMAFLRNLRRDTGFIVPTVNATAPAMIHKTRALGLAKQSAATALVEAKLAMRDTPQDADALIDLVLAFDQGGHKAEADAVFDASISIYRQLCDDFPASPSAHNLLAWAEGRTRRNLDEALKHALRSVELERMSAENTDTLAEVYFERGEFPQAIAQAARGVELAPTVEHYRQQLDKLKAAQAAKGK